MYYKERRLKGRRQAKLPAPQSNIAATKYRVVWLTRGQEERRLPTGAQVFNLPHKAAGKFVAGGEEIKML